MKRIGIIGKSTALALAAILSFSGCSEQSAAPVVVPDPVTGTYNGQTITETQISIERVDRSVKSDDGKVMANIYYNKPVISGDSNIASKINNFFGKECEGWLGGSNRLTHFQDGSLNLFLENVKDMRATYGDSSLAQQPLSYTVDTEVVLNNQAYLSIKQTTLWFSGGPSSKFYFGSTFDKSTGELVPFDHFTDVDANVFRENLAAFLFDNSTKFALQPNRDEIYRVFGPNDEHNYDFCYYGEKLKLNYEYYYDGKHIFIIINKGLSNSGIILQWNGKAGEAFEATILDHS